MPTINLTFARKAPPEFKRCITCDEVLSINEFVKRDDCIDFYSNQCKKCIAGKRALRKQKR